jgi:hypothetical protein
VVRATTQPPSTPIATLLDTRVFHVTHVRNLAGILGAGGILAGELPEVDLSSPLARELRATATVEALGAAVSAFVPWYLTPDAEVWNELRRGAAEARWSAAARGAASTDLVVLVSTVGSLAAVACSADALVVTDGDAAGTFTRFGAGPGGAVRMLARLHNTEQAAAAEVLVPDAVPLEAVQLIGVANEPQRDRVRALLARAGATTRVAVYPPWFAALD